MGSPVLDIPNFRLLDLIGQGGAGSVYLAEQLRPHRKVAIKIVSPDSLPTQFMNVLKEEGDIAALFEHDNLVTVIECGIIDDHYYLIEQYLSGGTLAERVTQDVSPADAVSIIKSIASALGHIHARGYVHRDVKPGNILFAESGKPVLADFGLAKAVETVGVLTEAGYTSGTPAYMSPEQIQSQTLDGRSDLYSLGIVLYELLTGQRPYFGISDFELRKAQVEQPVPRLPAALSQFQPILDRLLAKEPDERYADAQELILELEQLTEVSEDATQLTLAPRGPGKPAAPITDFASGIGWFREMSRRRIFRSMALYLVIAWGITEALTTVSENLHFPEWTRTSAIVLFIVGFPIAMALSWFFDMGPSGVYRARPFSRKGIFAIFFSVTVLLSTTALIVNDLMVEEVVEEPAQVEKTNSPSVDLVAESRSTPDGLETDGSRLEAEAIRAALADDLDVYLEKTASALELMHQSSDSPGDREKLFLMNALDIVGLSLLGASTELTSTQVARFIELVDGGLEHWSDRRNDARWTNTLVSALDGVERADPTAAASLYRKAIENWDFAGTEDTLAHGGTAMSLANGLRRSAWTHRRGRCSDTSLGLFNTVVDFLQSFGANPSVYAVLHADLAACLASRGQFADSERLFLQSVKSSNSDVTRGQLAALYSRWGRPKEALRTRNEMLVEFTRDLGPVEEWRAVSGRHGGHSAATRGGSVWVFGDTFIHNAPVLSSSWRWTKDLDASDEISFFQETNASDFPTQLIAFTQTELTYNLEVSNSESAPRWTFQPGPIITDPESGDLIVAYSKIRVRSEMIFDTETVGSSFARWKYPQNPDRSKVRPNDLYPTLLFQGNEPRVGSAAVLFEDHLYAYAADCHSFRCDNILARVPVDQVLERDAWRFYSAEQGWIGDWTAATVVIDSANTFSVHWNPHLQKLVAIYSPGFTNDIVLQTAEYPEGPWSPRRIVFTGELSVGNSIGFALAHPEYSRSAGRIEVISYSRYLGQFSSEIRIVELSLGQQEPADRTRE